MDFKGCDGVGWIHLVQDRVRWRPVVNTAMFRRILLKMEIS